MHDMISELENLPHPELISTLDNLELPISIFLGVISLFGSIGNILVIFQFGNLSFDCCHQSFRRSQDEKPGLCKRAIMVFFRQKVTAMNPEQGDKTVNRSSKTSRKSWKMVSSTNIFIILLAVNDLVICALIIPSTIFINVLLYEADPYGIFCKLETALNGSLLSVSMMLLLLIAIERTLVICFMPYKRLPKKWIIVILLFTYCVWSIDAAIMACSRKSTLRKRCSFYENFLFFDERTFSYYQIAKLSFFFVAMLGVILLYLVILLFICNLDFKWRMYNRSVYDMHAKTKQ
ncbi:hypothetical protein Ciccas_014014, partial [Cichlidogyrus casuarinus]